MSNSYEKYKKLNSELRNCITKGDIKYFKEIMLEREEVMRGVQKELLENAIKREQVEELIEEDKEIRKKIEMQKKDTEKWLEDQKNKSIVTSAYRKAGRRFK